MSEKVANLWRDRPEVIKEFLEGRVVYSHLAEEVAYILEKSVKAAGIKYSQILSRVKELNSFCEKVERKKYVNPLHDCTDIAGVRIVYLYISDIDRISDVIAREFNVIECVDKIELNDSERFGYGAVHYLVTIGGKSCGARYDELKELSCEIQVRTILQDSWAVVGHHLTYKQESEIPKKLRRKLNALAGLFETADDQFDGVRRELQSYANEVQKQFVAGGSEFLKSEINLDNLIQYLVWKFPDRRTNTREEIANLLSSLKEIGVSKLGEVEETINRTIDAVVAYETDDPPLTAKGVRTKYAQVGAARVAFRFMEEGPSLIPFQNMDKYRDLIKPQK